MNLPILSLAARRVADLLRFVALFFTARVVRVGLFVAFCCLGAVQSDGQILWSNSTTGGAWLSTGNWTGGAVPTTTEYAQFQLNPASTGQVGINMNGATNNGTNNQSVGGIEVTGNRAVPLIIGNSTTAAAGTLTLNGTTINSVSNTVLRNNTGQLFTIQQNVQTGTSALTVALGNATNNIINTDGSGGITISSIISGSGILTKTGTGGALTLSTGNTYTGKTLISAGTISASGESAFGASPATFTTDQITINGGGITSTGNIGFTSRRGLTIGVSGVTFNAANVAHTITINNQTVGTGAITKTGAGTLVINAGSVTNAAATSGTITAHTFSGGLTVTAGTLQLGATAVGTNIIPTTSNVTVNGGTFQVSRDQSITNFTMSSGTLTVPSGVTLTITGSYNVTGGTINNLGTIVLAGSTAMSFPGTGVTVNNGTASTMSALSISNSATVTLNAGFIVAGALSLSGGALDLGSQTLTLTGGSITGSGTRTIGGIGTIAVTTSLLTVNSALTSLVLNSGVTLTTSTGVDFGASGLTTINGIYQINNGGYTATNAPNYSSTSTLVYNILTSGYGVNNEWTGGGNTTTPTVGIGVPANVIIQGAGTGISLPSSGTRGTPGNITVSVSTNTLNLNQCDLYIGGNFTQNGTLTNSNSKALFFVGSAATQTISASGGTVAIPYFIINKSAGTVQLSSSPATNITMSAISGNVLQIFNAGILDLNGRSITISGSGGNILVSGGAGSITSSTTGAALNISGTKTVTNALGGTLSIGSNVTTVLTSSLDCGSSLTTINGTLQINNLGSVNTNPPTYASGSLLLYNTTGTYGRSNEWTTATSGAGYPANVQISNNTTLTSGSAGSMSGNLTIDNGSTFNMSSATSALNVSGNISVAGTLTLGSAFGGDINVTGNWTQAGTFTNNNRTVTFNGATADQTVSVTGTGGFAFLTVNKATSGNVILSSNINVASTLTMAKGLITTGANRVILAGTGSQVRTNGWVNGNLQRATSTSNATYDFFIGDASNYTPTTITFAANPTAAGTLTAKVTTGAHPNIGTTGLSTTKYVNRYWTVTNSGTTFGSYSGAFTYINGDLVGGATAANLKVGKYDAAWSLPTSSASGNTVTASGMTTFSDFVLAEPATQSQTITFNALAAKCSNDAAFALTATASSGLAVTYMSSNTSVATISGSTVTIVGAGTTDITASQAGNASYSAAPNVIQTLTVNAAPTVAAIAGASNVCVGATTTLTDATNGGTWSSSDETKATIAANGIVTGVATGTTTISYTVTSNGCTTIVTKSITVNARPSVSYTKVDDLCMDNNGTVTLTVTGGTPIYNIAWTNVTAQTANISTSGGSYTATGLHAATNYTFVITDANGCIAQ